MIFPPVTAFRSACWNRSAQFPCWCAGSILDWGICWGRTRAAECSQALGQKNTTLSIYLALTYASPIAALGPTFYVLWHNLWNAWQLYRASERKRRNG